MIGNRLNVLEIGQTIRDGVVEYWAARTDPDVEALPDRRLLMPGDAAVVAWDCDQLTVTLQGIGSGQSDDTAATAPQVGAGTAVFNTRHVIFEVLLLRCTPAFGDEEGNPPSDSELNIQGERSMRDAGMLSQALTHVAARIRPMLEEGVIARVGQILPVGPDGNFSGNVGLFQVTSLGLV